MFTERPTSSGRSAEEAPRWPEPKYDVQHVGEELCYVVDGAVRYTIDGEGFPLETGDSLHFRSELAHRCENRRDGITTVVWVFSDGLSF